MPVLRRPIYRYQPINQSPEQAVGIPLPFNKSSHVSGEQLETPLTANSAEYASTPKSGAVVFGQTFSTEEQAISNLKNLLMTFKGERYMQPNFGTRIREILFDNNTDQLRTGLENTLRDDIAFWLPYIEIANLEMNIDETGHQIRMLLRFRVTTVGANLVINILLSENALVVSDAEADAGQTLTEVGSIGQGSVFGAGDMAGGMLAGGTGGGAGY